MSARQKVGTGYSVIQRIPVYLQKSNNPRGVLFLNRMDIQRKVACMNLDLFVRFLQFYIGSRRNEVHESVFLVNYMYISSMKSKTATIFVSGNECLFLSTSFFLALLHDGSVPIIVGTMNNYVHFLFEIKTQPGVLLRPKR